MCRDTVIELAKLPYQFFLMVKISPALHYANEKEINSNHLVITFSSLKCSAEPVPLSKPYRGRFASLAWLSHIFPKEHGFLVLQ